MMINCCICNNRITDIDSNNAWPAAQGRCCVTCNMLYVVPKRLQLHMQQQAAQTTSQQQQQRVKEIN